MTMKESSFEALKNNLSLKSKSSWCWTVGYGRHQKCLMS